MAVFLDARELISASMPFLSISILREDFVKAIRPAQVASLSRAQASVA
jgi:hypothetical protein